MHFKLTIDLGNDAMREPGDVADALRDIATRIERDELTVGTCGGAIRDINGNRVGEYAVHPKGASS